MVVKHGDFHHGIESAKNGQLNLTNPSWGMVAFDSNKMQHARDDKSEKCKNIESEWQSFKKKDVYMDVSENSGTP